MTGSIDAELAILASCAVRHGLDITAGQAGNSKNPAALTFPTTAEALEFLEQTVHLTDYRLGTNIALTLLPPTEFKPRAQVCWVPSLTGVITSAWRGKPDENHGHQ